MVSVDSCAAIVVSCVVSVVRGYGKCGELCVTFVVSCVVSVLKVCDERVW